MVLFGCCPGQQCQYQIVDGKIMMVWSSFQAGEYEMAGSRAFPVELRERAQKAVHVLSQGQLHAPSARRIAVCIGTEQLYIPYRVYYDRQQLRLCMAGPEDVATIALCLGTRHHDGFLREQCLRGLLTVDEAWVAPFVVSLLGEYVLEIIEPICERFLNGVERKYLDFFADNPGYGQYLQCRAISYWNAYYRHRFANVHDYPGVSALRALTVAAKREISCRCRAG